jgi:hypothetical protein
MRQRLRHQFLLLAGPAQASIRWQGARFATAAALHATSPPTRARALPAVLADVAQVATWKGWKAAILKNVKRG